MWEGGFKLRKQKTNDPVLYDIICQMEMETDPRNNDSDTTEERYAKETLGSSEQTFGGKSKVLGIGWDNSKDTLEHSLGKTDQDITLKITKKRNIK